jgi:hypothetical protein
MEEIRNIDMESSRKRELKWKDDIKMDLRETGYENIQWLEITHNSNQCRVSVNTDIKYQDP